MDETRRRELIERYREGAGAVEAALDGLSDEELDHRPADGGWSPREVAHHMGDSEMMSAIRLRRLLAEEAPTIQGYDEMEFSQRLHYDSRPVEPSLAAMRAARESSLTILERLSPREWERAGTHSESGPYSLETWLEIYAAHGHDHAEQIRRGVTERRSGSS